MNQIFVYIGMLVLTSMIGSVSAQSTPIASEPAQIPATNPATPPAMEIPLEKLPLTMKGGWKRLTNYGEIGAAASLKITSQEVSGKVTGLFTMWASGNRPPGQCNHIIDLPFEGTWDGQKEFRFQVLDEKCGRIIRNMTRGKEHYLEWTSTQDPTLKLWFDPI